MCLFIINKKEKEIQKKRNIKSRKIDKRKRKMLVSKAFHNTKQEKKLYESSIRRKRSRDSNWKS